MQFSVKSIAILGGGTAGWSAAAMFAERFKKLNVKITLIESPAIATVGVGEATVPAILAVHKNLNISEREFINATQATFKLGIQFKDWNHLGGDFFHPFGQFGMAIGGVDFHQCWAKLQQQGNAQRLEDFSLCASLAKAGRFALPDNESSNPLVWHGYAYHFDAGLYANFLQEYSLKRDVKRLSATVTSVEKDPTNGFIKKLHLDSGDSVEADLFIDCSGFRSLLLGEQMRVDYIDWTEHLPCDRAVAVQTESDGALLPYTTSTAMSAGWRWQIPLQNRMGNGYAYSSQYIDDKSAKNELLSVLGQRTITEPRVIHFKAGMRENFWVKNCVAIGLSSGFIEPLESTSISLMHTGIYKVIDQMPDLQVSSKGIEKANHLNTQEYERIRDFIIFHYHASKRDDSEFWRDARAKPLPATLQRKLDDFLRDGTLTQYEMESFREPSWLAMYNGFNLWPKSCLPSAQALPTEQLAEVFERMKSAIKKGVAHAPSHTDFLKTV